LLFQHETELLEDSFAFPSFQPFSKFGSSEDELMDTEDISNNQLPVQSNRIQNQFIDSKPVMVPAASLKHDLKWRNVASNWIRRVVSAYLCCQLIQLVKILLIKSCQAFLE